MASIGELTATVRADISGYVGPMRQVATTNQQVAASVASVTSPVAAVGETMTAAGVQGANWTKVLERIEHVSTLVGVETLGLGTHFGRLASQMGPLLGVGGTFALLAAGVAIVSAAYEKFTADARAQKQVVDDLVTSYDNMTGATIRLRREQALQAVADAQKGHPSIIGTTNVAGIPVPLMGVTFDTEELTRANQALQAAQREYDDWNTQHHQPNLTRTRTLTTAASDATRALADAMEEIKRKGAEFSGEKNPQATVIPGLDAQTINATKKAMQAVKDAANSTNQWTDVAQGAAQGFAHAFTDAFRGQSKGLLESIASVLKNAILGAIDKLISEKVFEALMHAFSASKGGGSGTGGWVKDIVGSVFSAPSVPMAGAMAGGGTVMVSGASIPPALSPVEHARDQQWQALLIESNRVAEANGARWRYVSR